METETVFEFGGEGGSIAINRQTGPDGIKFIYRHSEFDPTDEGLGINDRFVYNDFETAFQLLNSKYYWYSLHIDTIHEDFRDYIISQLIQKLNDDTWSHQHADHFKKRLEDTLQIKLGYEEKNGWYLL